MGLGTVLTVEFRTLTVLFLATGETRTYAKQTAPLTRVTFVAGDTITTHDGLVVEVTETRNVKGLLVYIGRDTAGKQVEVEEAQLDNFLQLNRPSERLFNGQIDQDKWFELRYQTLQHINRLAHSDLYGLIGCRTSLIPHQLYIANEVAHRYAPRVLLADEVGLGKTIEAGLILHHQLLTERARRVLIVVPETLVHQWLVEMLRRFNLHFRIFDEERWQSLLGTGEEPDSVSTTENPFHSEQLVLCSLKFLTSDAERFQQCLAGEWDLLVVDEAHHLEWSPGHASYEYETIDKLAAVTRGVLLLTATPEQLGKDGHFARLRLLDPDRFPDFDKFVKEENSYEPIAQVVDDLLNNKKLDDADRQVIKNTFGEGDNESALAELMNSEIDSDENQQARIKLVEHLLDRHGTGRVLFRNTRAVVKGFPERKVFSYPLPMPDVYSEQAKNTAKTGVSVDALLTPELQYKQAGNLQWTDIDPRINWLTEKLIDIHPEKTLVITANAQSALDITQHLKTQTGLRAAAFHEGLSIIERDRAAASFADKETGAHVLICSEIGSEGRNFQFAHHMILFDLPLNPDLLEQRIGRLDRIGQADTIRIHVPYLEHSAQDVMFQWYHQGLSAFEHTCPAGLSVYTQVHDELHAALKDPASFFSGSLMDELIQHTKTIYHELIETLHRGRDRLLEYNSCRTHLANELKARAVEEDNSHQQVDLHDYMEDVFDCFGVNTELHSENCIIISPTDNMINRFPGLAEDGMTITYSRETALSFEDAHYITWEHPIVVSTLDMVLGNEMGNTAVTVMKYKGAQAGSVLLECLYSLEAAPIEALQTSRYLPPTTIRVVMDEKGHDHDQKLSHAAINAARSSVDASTAQKVIRAKQDVLKLIIDRSRALAEARMPAILEEAHERSRDTLMREINRLKALSLVNPNVRDDEIAFFENQLALLTEVLDSASLRVDALRVIVVT